MQLNETVDRLSIEMSVLPPGPLAELRRMNVEGPGAAAFWRLAARCEFSKERPEPWMRFVKIMAILTPRGGPADRPRVHDPKRPLGEVLCNGGDPVGWPGSETLDPRPFISESRLARLLAQHPEKRAATLERFARMLAGRRDPQTGINCADIAALVLDSGNKSTLATLARHYYRRLDRASRRATQQETAA